MSILQILEDIGADTKRSHKLSLIEQHKENELFLKVVKLALDPYVSFFIKKIPSYTANGTKSLDWAISELEHLSERNVTGNAGIEHLTTVLSNISQDDATVIERIIGKDLRCGMADGIVNAVINKFIPTYPCLLARPFDEKNIKNIQFPALSQLKADGVRVNFHINGDKITVCGRSGKNIDLLGALDQELIKIGSYFSGRVVIDGELVVRDKYGKLLSRKIGNGIINKAIRGTISPEEASMICAQIWDVIPLDEFHAGKSKKQYKERFEEISQALASAHPDSEDKTEQTLKGLKNKIWIIDSVVVNNIEEAQAHFEKLLAEGEEGTILKNFAGFWEDTRSKHLVKLKAEKDCDLEVIGWNPGEGKFAGQVGSLICATSDQKVEVAISGFSDDLRAEITRDINEWVGGIVAVLYNEKISNKARPGVYSLFLPRFAERRYDKTIANTSDEVK